VGKIGPEFADMHGRHPILPTRFGSRRPTGWQKRISQTNSNSVTVFARPAALPRSRQGEKKIIALSLPKNMHGIRQNTYFRLDRNGGKKLN